MVSKKSWKKCDNYAKINNIPGIIKVKKEKTTKKAPLPVK